MSKCFRCGAELQPGQVDCSLIFNTGQPTRKHGGAPNVHVFKEYVDPNISLDGKPVLITSAAQKRALLNGQWDGDHMAKIREREGDDDSRYRTKHWKEYVTEKQNRATRGG